MTTWQLMCQVLVIYTCGTPVQWPPSYPQLWLLLVLFSLPYKEPKPQVCSGPQGSWNLTNSGDPFENSGRWLG